MWEDRVLQAERLELRSHEFPGCGHGFIASIVPRWRCWSPLGDVAAAGSGVPCTIILAVAHGFPCMSQESQV